MHNHLIHSAEADTNQHTLISPAWDSCIQTLYDDLLAPGFQTPLLCQDLPLCNAERHALSGGTIHCRQVKSCLTSREFLKHFYRDCAVWLNTHCLPGTISIQRNKPQVGSINRRIHHHCSNMQQGQKQFMGNDWQRRQGQWEEKEHMCIKRQTSSAGLVHILIFQRWSADTGRS